MKDHTAAILIDQLLEKRVFSCVRCHNLLQPPVMLIEKKGNMCFLCYEEFRGKDKIVAVENVALCTILEEIDYPCIYKIQGCDKRLKHKDMKEHKEKCMYQTFSCIFSSVCLWNGCVQNVVAHCKENHVDRILSDIYDHNKLPKLQELIYDVENYSDSTFADTCDSYKVGCLQDLVAQKKETSSSSSNVKDTKLKNEKDRRDGAYVLETSCGIFILKMKKLESNLNVLIYNFSQVDKEKENMFSVTFSGVKGTKYSKRNKSIKDVESFIKCDDKIATRFDLGFISNGIFSDDEDVQMIVKLINVENDALKDDVLKQIQCTKCKRYAKSRVSRCREKHNICSSCESQSTVKTRCPKCNTDYLPESYSGLEKLADLIELPCRFKANGCMMKVRNDLFHELVCEYGTSDCFISGCGVHCSHFKLISHVMKDHTVPNCFANLSELKITRSSKREVYHVIEHNLVFELVFEIEAHIPSFSSNCTPKKPHVMWRVNIIRGYDPEPYAFEVRIYLGDNHPVKEIALKGQCGNENLLGFTDTRMKVPVGTLFEIGADEIEFNCKVRVFKDI